MSSESSRAARTPSGMNRQPPTSAEAMNSRDGIRTSLSGSVNSSGPTPANWSASPTANSAADAYVMRASLVAQVAVARSLPGARVRLGQVPEASDRPPHLLGLDPAGIDLDGHGAAHQVGAHAHHAVDAAQPVLDAGHAVRAVHVPDPEPDRGRGRGDRGRRASPVPIQHHVVPAPATVPGPTRPPPPRPRGPPPLPDRATPAGTPAARRGSRPPGAPGSRPRR